MSDYDEAKAELVQLIAGANLPMPIITRALDSDPCDVTDAHLVRLNAEAAEGMNSTQHARHVFGHWLADLHGAESYENPTRPGFEGASEARMLRARFTSKDRDKAEQLYRKGLSLNEVAEKIGVPVITIYDELRKRGVVRRKTCQES